jgi:hypothetical protein
MPRSAGHLCVGQHFMDERLVKQWAVTGTLLQAASSEIKGSTAFVACRYFLEHNELELALDVLEEAGHELVVSRDFWWNLKKAAEVMGLSERYCALRAQVRIATIAAQQGVSSDYPNAPLSGS